MFHRVAGPPLSIRSPAAGRLHRCLLPASVGDLPDFGLYLNSNPGSGPGFLAPRPPRHASWQLLHTERSSVSPGHSAPPVPWPLSQKVEI